MTRTFASSSTARTREDRPSTRRSIQRGDGLQYTASESKRAPKITEADDKETVVLTSGNSKDFMLGGVPHKVAVVSTHGGDGRFKIMIWQDPNKLEIFTKLTEKDVRRVE